MSKRKNSDEETVQSNKKSKYDIKWENNRLRLIEFYEKYGHYNVPTRWEKDQQLGNWVHRQKTEFRKYKMDPSKSWLSAERVSLLKEMGAIDSWLTASLIRTMNTNPRTWEESYALLKAYRDAHGGCCNVPDRWKKDPQLGLWVKKQKAQWRSSKMSAERVSLLKEMGAIDSWLFASLIRSMNTKARTWEESCALLKAYRDAHGGDCNIPAKWKDDPQLGGWVHRQKAQFRKYKVDPSTSWLSAERVSSLKKMGAIKSWFPSDKSYEESNDKLINSIMADLL